MATYSSDLYAKQTSETSTREQLRPDELGARQRIIKFQHTIADTAWVTGDLINLCVVPAGCTIDLKDSFLKFSADQGAATHLDIGYAAYTKKDGSTAAADPDGIIDGLDAGNSHSARVQLSASTLGAGVEAPMGTIKLNSREPVVLTCSPLNAGGTYDGDIGDTLDIQLTYWVD